VDHGRLLVSVDGLVSVQDRLGAKDVRNSLTENWEISMLNLGKVRWFLGFFFVFEDLVAWLLGRILFQVDGDECLLV
jgi:hypothetical protein